jgi:hypothetical protein
MEGREYERVNKNEEKCVNKKNRKKNKIDG